MIFKEDMQSVCKFKSFVITQFITKIKKLKKLEGKKETALIKLTSHHTRLLYFNNL